MMALNIGPERDAKRRWEDLRCPGGEALEKTPPAGGAIVFKKLGAESAASPDHCASIAVSRFMA